jgi:L-ascorbate metabolism protein UlaG (beta-lactamase superfamily)
MKIKWNGHASFTITSDKGTVIVTDPYDPSGYGGVLKYNIVTDKADGALVSHDHFDHNYVQGLTGSPKVLKGSGEVKEIKVKGIATHHDESKGSERGENTVFSFVVDGVNVCFVGDLGHRLTPDKIKEIGKVDLLLVPVGGTFTLDAAGAADVSKALNAKIIIPMHFQTDKCMLPISSVDTFLSLMTNIKKLEKNEIELSSDKVPATGQEVWVMNFAC